MQLSWQVLSSCPCVSAAAYRPSGAPNMMLVPLFCDYPGRYCIRPTPGLGYPTHTQPTCCSRPAPTVLDSGHCHRTHHMPKVMKVSTLLPCTPLLQVAFVPMRLALGVTRPGHSDAVMAIDVHTAPLGLCSEDCDTFKHDSSQVSALTLRCRRHCQTRLELACNGQYRHWF